jgi:hypothetical protein
MTSKVASISSPEGKILYTYDPATGNHIETKTVAPTNAQQVYNDTLYGYDNQGQVL